MDSQNIRMEKLLNNLENTTFDLLLVAKTSLHLLCLDRC